MQIVFSVLHTAASLHDVCLISAFSLWIQRVGIVLWCEIRVIHRRCASCSSVLSRQQYSEGTALPAGSRLSIPPTVSHSNRLHPSCLLGGNGPGESQEIGPQRRSATRDRWYAESTDYGLLMVQTERPRGVQAVMAAAVREALCPVRVLVCVWEKTDSR